MIYFVDSRYIQFFRISLLHFTYLKNEHINKSKHITDLQSILLNYRSKHKKEEGRSEGRCSDCICNNLIYHI